MVLQTLFLFKIVNGAGSFRGLPALALYGVCQVGRGEGGKWDFGRCVVNLMACLKYRRDKCLR